MRSDITITGGLGYLGCNLIKLFAESGYSLCVIDNLMYDERPLENLRRSLDFRFIKGDVRNNASLTDAVSDTSAVIHLAAIVGDAACNVDPDYSWDINYQATVDLARLAKRHGVSRFIFASSCSVYGRALGIVDETSGLNPLSQYAESRVRSEKVLSKLANSRFRVISLRMATLFGPSERMRFDLVVNLFAALAATHRPLTVEGGNQWRPFLHVRDAAEAYSLALQNHPAEPFKVYNVGRDENNLTIRDVANQVAELSPTVEVKYDTNASDERSYRVSFQRIRKDLGYQPGRTVGEGVREILHLFRQGYFEDFPDASYSNLDALRSRRSLPKKLHTMSG